MTTWDRIWTWLWTLAVLPAAGVLAVVGMAAARGNSPTLAAVCVAGVGLLGVALGRDLERARWELGDEEEDGDDGDDE